MTRLAPLLASRNVLAALLMHGISGRYVEISNSYNHPRCITVLVPKPRDYQHDQWADLMVRVGEALADAGLTVTERDVPAVLLVTR
jgi:hypothetical protein